MPNDSTGQAGAPQSWGQDRSKVINDSRDLVREAMEGWDYLVARKRGRTVKGKAAPPADGC